MLVKWICLSRLQIGKDLLTVLIILLKHVKIFHFNNQKCFYYKLLLVSRFCLSLFSRKFIAFLNTVKPLKKRRGLISFLSLKGGLFEGGGGGLIEDLSYLGLVISKSIIWSQSNHVTCINATLPSRTLSLVICLQQACNMSCTV